MNPNEVEELFYSKEKEKVVIEKLIDKFESKDAATIVNEIKELLVDHKICEINKK